MSLRRKLQVFVSSTFSDLRTERQAAVEAILTAGHIPAGMELFAAGDESQMVVIRRWIDESDVFLLILAGRYGSIEPETTKSYIHLEYDYAAAQGKPLFAVVILPEALERKARDCGSSVVETEHSRELCEFRATVESRMVRFWEDPRDIKLAILETLPEFATRSAIGGWVRSEESVNTAAVADEVTRLSRENAALRERLSLVNDATSSYAGLSFDQLYELLAITPPQPRKLDPNTKSLLDDIAAAFGHKHPSVLHVLWWQSAQLARFANLERVLPLAEQLHEFGLIELRPGSAVTYTLSDVGRRFLLRLRASRDVALLEQFRERDLTA